MLKVKQKLGFGIFDLGGNMLFTVMGFWCLNYLTDTVGLNAALAGAAVLISKLWDAVTDPIMGYLSDRTRSRWGRRRPYLLFGALPVFLTLWLFFSAPAFSSPTLLLVWATLVLLALNTASTVITIPYSSLTPELTDDYHERTVLNGYRFGCAVFGTIIGAAAVQPIVGLAADKRSGFSLLGMLLGGIIAATTLLTFIGTREKEHKELPTQGFFASYKAVFTNRPYLIVLFTYAIHLTALTLVQGIIVYYTKYVYEKEELTTTALVILLLVAMSVIPLSVVVSKKIGKKNTYQICFIIMASACLAIFALGHTLGTTFFLAIMLFAGIGVGFSYVAPFAMVPDAIEYEALKSGERKEGVYYGIWTFMSKVGQSAAVFISGLILSWGGYIADVPQSSRALWAIRLTIGPLPAGLFIAAALLIQHYPLDEKTYQTMLSQAESPTG